jgi:antitoxin component of MazEF toxin-antitoxin module
MCMKDRAKKKPSETEIDQIVTAQANDDSAWEKPVHVRSKQSLKKLVSRIPKNHKVKELDWGKPVGREAW